jgi:hypothetical protein
MEMHGVSRTVVREAISHLQAAGLVQTRHGIGTFVLEPQPTNLFAADTIRTIHSAALSTSGPDLSLTWSGNGFLYRMVRLLTGAAVHAAQGRLRLDDLATLLDQPPGLPHGKSPLCAPPAPRGRFASGAAWRRPRPPRGPPPPFRGGHRTRAINCAAVGASLQRASPSASMMARLSPFNNKADFIRSPTFN